MSRSLSKAAGIRGEEPSDGRENTRGEGASSDKVNILIVDDRPENLMTLSTILESPDVQIIQARSGKDALRCALNHDFAAILLDVHMPEIDGFETAALIRQRKSSARTPIIFITAYSDEARIYQGYALGAVDYILTPVQPDVLRAKVAVFVDLFRKTLEIQRQAELLREAERKLRRQAEYALADSEQRFRVTFNQAAVGMALIDPSGEWLDVNQKLCDILRCPRPLLLQQRLRDLITVESLPADVDPFAPRAEEQALEGRHRCSDGHVVWLHLVTSLVLQPDGRPRCVIVVIEDVTSRRLAEDELKALNDHLERRVAERTDELRNSHDKLRRSERLASLGTLAAGIAHEINNPLNAILLSSQYALEFVDEMKDVQIQETFDSIIHQARRCGTIVKNVLRFAKEEATPKEPCDIIQLVHRATTLVRTYMEAPGLTLQVYTDEGLPDLMLNPTQIEQVLVNLIQNAVQAGLNGQVFVDLKVQRCGNVVKLNIADNGRGIAPEKLLHIFDPFYSTRQGQGGTGLGLSIAHSIIADHGGTIDVESEPGKGTTFTLSFPVPGTLPASQQISAAEPRPITKSQRVA